MVEPQYTSKTCSECGQVNHKITIKDKIFICEECGHEQDRDVNAALVIQQKGAKTCTLGTFVS